MFVKQILKQSSVNKITKSSFLFESCQNYYEIAALINEPRAVWLTGVIKLHRRKISDL